MSTKHTKPAKHTSNTSTPRGTIAEMTASADPVALALDAGIDPVALAADNARDALCDLSYNVLLPIAGCEGDAALALAAARIVEADEHTAPGYLNDAALALCRIEAGKTTANPGALAARLLRITHTADAVTAHRRAKEASAK